MFEVIFLVCTFANAHSVDLVCKEQTQTHLETCGVEIDSPRLYHPANNPRGDMFIKGVSCSKMKVPNPPVLLEEDDEEEITA